MADNIDLSGLNSKMKQLRALPHEVMLEAHKAFVDFTPVRTGNARRNTKLNNDDTIVTTYPYAGKLDAGVSKQAPQGMTQPTEKLLQKIIDTKVKKEFK